MAETLKWNAEWNTYYVEAEYVCDEGLIILEESFVLRINGRVVAEKKNERPWAFVGRRGRLRSLKVVLESPIKQGTDSPVVKAWFHTGANADCCDCMLSVDDRLLALESR